MKEKEIKKVYNIKIIFIVLFIILNFLNGFLSVTSFFNRNLSSYPRNTSMVIGSILGDLGIIILFLGLAFVIFKKDINRFRFLIGFTVVSTIFCFVSAVFFYNYGMMFSFWNLSFLNNPKNSEQVNFISSMAQVLLRRAQYLTLVPIVVLSVYQLTLIRKHRFNRYFLPSFGGNGKKKYILGCSVIVLGLLMVSSSRLLYKSNIKDTWFEDNRSSLYGMQSLGFHNFITYDFYSKYIVGEKDLSAKEYEEIKNKLDSYKNPNQINPIDGLTYGNSEERAKYQNKNLILIQAESLNNFVIGLKVNGKEITPTLNNMARNGAYFSNFYTSVGLGNTSDAEFSVNTGLYPIGDDISIYKYNNHSYETLAKDFKKSDYNTFAFHGNDGNFYNRYEAYKNVYGYDKFYGLADISHKEEELVHGWVNDVDLLKKVGTVIKETPEKDFAFAITVSAHTPFVDSPQINKVLNELNFSLEKDVSDPLFCGYLEHYRYVDECIKQALEYYQEIGILNDTIIALYGDHGANIDINEFSVNKDTFTNEVNPFNKVFSNQLKYLEESRLEYHKLNAEIPFIIYEGTVFNGGEAIITPRVIEQSRGQIDIYRTMSNLFALDSKYYFGIDALSTQPGIVYNPKGLDIFIDNAIVSGTSEKSNPKMSKEDTKKIVKAFRDLKDFNDKLLRYKILPDSN